ncbi:ABC transporter substrate-binding protein [Acuticoccus mangrovi]|uniref:Solute-binding protein family 5 domain-containing protein n=1 Tax=Acuticoccus mangrovi TaxID=2796142 RepID=A0A934MDL1_9HYPH|nr:ABC transporter substrate-binding protein [Acuticoccus mangrovi]MBJ3776487.1 hypothetical protein [Acuticoccus mangrovi]
MRQKLNFLTTRRDVLRYGAAASSLAATGLGPASVLAQEGGEFDEFKIGIWSGVPNLDPEQNSIRTCIVCQNWIFDPLLFRDKDTNELKPYLATEYSYVGDNRWRFKIHEGVMFHNGEPLDAAAVKFSLERRKSDKVGSPFQTTFADVLDCEIIDDTTFEFVCANPFPMMPAYLPTFSIMPPKYYSEHDLSYLALNPVGSGPFKLVEFRPDDVVRVERNEDYWGEKPVIKRVTATIVQEDATRVASLLAGDFNITGRPVMEDFDRIDANPGTRVSATIGNRVVFAGFNFDMPPFDNKLVRQAANYAVDAAIINEVYLRSTGELMASALPSTVPGYDPAIEPYAYDPDKAKALLAEAGFPDGFETTIEVHPGWLIAGMEVTQAIANFLKEVGIKVNLVVSDAGTMAAHINDRTAGPIYVQSWGGNSTFDADSYIQVLFDEGSWSCNHMPEIGALVQAGRATADQAERIKVYQEACRIIHEEAPWIFLYLQPNTYGVTTDTDWEGRPDEMIPLYYLKKIA